ncbi:MAG: hypothetical protein ABIZ36_10890 [Gemmatimonadaceae bacterium]
MTRSQFAMAVGADDKWVENTARLLRRRVKYTPLESVWLGLVRVLNQEVGLTLARSDELAREALGLEQQASTTLLGQTETGVAGISVDLARYRSSHAASLSAALEFGGERRRGRPRPLKPGGKRAALERAARYGVDIDLLREGLKIPVAERLKIADQNAAFVAQMQLGIRGRVA